MTETINLQAVLKSNPTPQVQKKPRLAKPPQCGLLTRTVAETRLFDSILPVRLRGSQHNDVAFIGVRLPHSLEPLALSLGPSTPTSLTDAHRKRSLGAFCRRILQGSVLSGSARPRLASSAHPCHCLICVVLTWFLAPRHSDMRAPERWKTQRSREKRGLRIQNSKRRRHRIFRHYRCRRGPGPNVAPGQIRR